MEDRCSSGYFYEPVINDCILCQTHCKPPWSADLEKLCRQVCVISTTTLLPTVMLPTVNSLVTSKTKPTNEQSNVTWITIIEGSIALVLFVIVVVLAAGLICNRRSKLSSSKQKPLKHTDNKQNKYMNNVLNPMVSLDKSIPRNSYKTGNSREDMQTSIVSSAVRWSRQNSTYTIHTAPSIQHNHSIQSTNIHEVLSAENNSYSITHSESRHGDPISAAGINNSSSKETSLILIGEQASVLSHSVSIKREIASQDKIKKESLPLLNQVGHNSEHSTTFKQPRSQLSTNMVNYLSSLSQNSNVAGMEPTYNKEVISLTNVHESNRIENEMHANSLLYCSQLSDVPSHGVIAQQAQDGYHFDGNDFEPERVNCRMPGHFDHVSEEQNEDTFRNHYIDIPQENEGFLPAGHEIMERSYSNDSGAGSIVDPEFQQRSGFHDLHAENNPIYQQLQNLPWVMGYHSQGRSISVYANLDQLDKEILHRQLVDVTGQPREKFKMRQNTIN